jgi:hypothetical protein
METNNCITCDQLIANRFFNLVPDGAVCDDCFDRLYQKCLSCNEPELVGRPHVIMIDGQTQEVCRKCFERNFVTCSECHSICRKDNSFAVDSARRICRTCNDKRPSCVQCSRRGLSTITTHIGACCTSCADKLYIQSYSTKPTPLFFGYEDLHFGIELEVEMPGGVRYPILHEVNQPWLYFKSDSSIGHGVEIVTHPLSFEWIKENEKTITKFLGILRHRGCRGFESANCGMHVHITKKGMNSLHILKFMQLMYLNPLFTLLVSQRERDKLNLYASMEDSSKHKLYREATSKFNEGSRNQAVNLTDHTAEVRIFKSNIRPASFFKNIEYCHSMYVYSKQCSLKDATLEKYIEFVTANFKTYPNLAAFLIENSKKINEIKKQAICA